MKAYSLNSKTRAARGFSLVEALIVIAVIGLVTALIASVFGSVISSPAKLQSKGDTLNSDVVGMYRLQRDIRATNVNDVFTCNTTGTITCNALSSSPTTVQAQGNPGALAIVTNKTGGQGQWQFSATDGKPAWTGFVVYFLPSNLNPGDETDLKEKYEPSNLSAGVDSTKAAAAVMAAVAATDALTAAPNVTQLVVSANTSANTILLKMAATSTVHGRTNSTSFESDTFARN